MAEGVIHSVVDRVVDSLFRVVKRDIGYMWNYTQNVEKFKNALQNLKDMKGRVQQQIDLANGKGDNLIVGAKEWVDEVEVEISKAEVFLDQEASAKKTCFNLGMCGNWGTLYRYGKMATKKAPSLLEHQVRGTSYESSASVETRAPGVLDVYQSKNLDDINTHKLALGEVIAAIEDESIQIVGIYGVGGVGKTTLAKEVVARVKNLFADFAFISVSQNVDVEKIRNDILVATKRIMKGEKVLIILDDVWEEIEFEKLCIPYGINYKNCKILLTSRLVDVYEKMNVQSIIWIDSLPIEEAWIIFKGVVGDIVETDVKLKEIAIEIVKECGGLPLIIQAIGKALKNKSIRLWVMALTRLKKHAPSHIAPGIKKAYTHLKLSYDYLESEEVKSCFLLCSMFPEDENIYLENLVFYVSGLAKFNNLESMDDARVRIQNAVDILICSGLLLYTMEVESTKMHDVVRDVAILIASEAKNNFLVEAGKGLTEWLPRNNTLESYTGISLVDNNISKIPDYEIHLPHLDTFLIQDNKLSTISNEFIGSMKEVRVLDMAWNEITSLPQSMKLLTKLRILNLENNRYLCEISVLGELKDLEILILHETGIKEIPREIGQLANLRRFDVSFCKDLSHITPGVISKLWRLEELLIGFYSMHGGIYDIMVEVMNLPKLAYLHLFVPCFEVFPEGFINSGSLNGFVIQIGEIQNTTDDFGFNWISERRLVLATKDLNISFVKRIEELINVSPFTVLDSILNLNNIMPTLYYEGFNKLENIQLKKCPNVSCLVDTNDWDELQTFHSSTDLHGDDGKTEEKFFKKLKHLNLSSLYRLEVLWNCPYQHMSLSNLVTLDIDECHRLVRVFTVSIAQGLANLQELIISHCYGLEEVIWDGDDETNKCEAIVAENVIVFPSLTDISFTCLHSLKSFCSGNSTIKYPSLEQVDILDCKIIKIWGRGIQDTPKLRFVDDVPLDGPYAINDAVVKSTNAWKEKVARDSTIWDLGMWAEDQRCV